MRTWSPALGPKGRYTRPRLAQALGPVVCALGFVAAAGFVVAALGCSARPGPARVAHLYAAGLKERAAEEAYAALHHDIRSRLSPAEFTRRLHDDQVRTRQDAADIEQALTDAEALVVFSECASGLLFEYENGDWKLASSSIELYSQASPLEAIRTFVRAFRARRFDVLKRLVAQDISAGNRAPRVKTKLTPDEEAELSASVDSIALALEHPRIEVLGPRARMSYGAGKSIELVLEGPEWKIEDYDP